MYSVLVYGSDIDYEKGRYKKTRGLRNVNMGKSGENQLNKSQIKK